MVKVILVQENDVQMAEYVRAALRTKLHMKTTFSQSIHGVGELCYSVIMSVLTTMNIGRVY